VFAMPSVYPPDTQSSCCQWCCRMAFRERTQPLFTGVLIVM
jgi:hypothetical protein